MGKHDAKPITRWRKFLIWCCSEGRHIMVELPVGLAAILAYELILSPHGAENLHYIMSVL